MNDDCEEAADDDDGDLDAQVAAGDLGGTGGASAPRAAHQKSVRLSVAGDGGGSDDGTEGGGKDGGTSGKKPSSEPKRGSCGAGKKQAPLLAAHKPKSFGKRVHKALLGWLHSTVKVHI